MCLRCLFFACLLLPGFSLTGENIPGLKVVYSPDGIVLLKFPKYHKGSFEIPSGVTEIGSSAFSDCRYLDNVLIPDTVVKIGSGAFSGCYSLTEIVLPASVKDIGISAFRECRNLKSFTAKGTGVSLGDAVLIYCESLETVDIRGAVTVGDMAFMNCPELLEIRLPMELDYTRAGISKKTRLVLIGADGIMVCHTGYDHLWWVAAPDGLPLHSSTEAHATPIASLPNGSPCELLPRDESELIVDGFQGHWAKIRGQNSEGWIFDAMLNDAPENEADVTLDMPKNLAKKTTNQGMTLSKTNLEGIWYRLYSSEKYGKPLSQAIACNTGYFFTFRDDGTCVAGWGGYEATESGSFTLEGTTIHCIFDRDETSAFIYSVRNYQVVLVDATHLQLSDPTSGEWSLFALYDPRLDRYLKNPRESMRCREYIQEKAYLTSSMAGEETLLMMASRTHNLAIVEWLLELPGTEANARDRFGRTALHHVLQNESDPAALAITRCLLDHGAAINAIDDFGRTPLDCTQTETTNRQDQKKVRQLLAKAGGKSSRKRWSDRMTDQDYY